MLLRGRKDGAFNKQVTDDVLRFQRAEDYQMRNTGFQDKLSQSQRVALYAYRNQATQVEKKVQVYAMVHGLISSLCAGTEQRA